MVLELQTMALGGQGMRKLIRHINFARVPLWWGTAGEGLLLALSLFLSHPFSQQEFFTVSFGIILGAGLFLKLWAKAILLGSLSHGRLAGPFRTVRYPWTLGEILALAAINALVRHPAIALLSVVVCFGLHRQQKPLFDRFLTAQLGSRREEFRFSVPAFLPGVVLMPQGEGLVSYSWNKALRQEALSIAVFFVTFLFISIKQF